MADDVVLPGTGTTIATDDIGSGRQVQLIKPVYGPDGTATMVTPDAGLPSAQSATTLTGSANANATDLIASTEVGGYQTFSIQLSGTFSASVAVQGSNNGTAWQAIYMSWMGGNPGAPSNASINTTSPYAGPINYRYIRVRTTAYTSGTVTAHVRLSSGSPVSPTSETVAVTPSGANSATDAASLSYWAVTSAVPYGFNGASFDRSRHPRIFKSVTTQASGDTAVWTPTTGKRFQLLRFMVAVTADAATSGGAVVTLALRDATTATGLAVPVYIPGTGGTALGGWSSGWIDVGGYGYRSSSLNQTLNVNLSAALTAGVVGIIACGTEE